MVHRQGAGQLTQPGAGSAGTAPDPALLRIATRESRLALWQAGHVADLLRERYPACKVELVGMTTRGDQIQDRPLSQVGGKALFTKELEIALLDGRADLAVHSLKDVPMELPEGFAVASGGATQPVPALPAGAASQVSPVTWKVRAGRREGSFTLRVRSSTGVSQSLPVQIKVRGIFGS